jgi:hypothetical protein
MEGVVTALSSITHNGGERNGTVTQLRREKFVQPNGKVERVPVISGNSIRGILRDKGMFSMLKMLGYGINEENGKVNGLSLQAFYFLFSGGSLVSTGDSGLDIKYFREMRDLIPLIGLFGGAAGNAIMPGKMKIGKLIPICKETSHLVPEKFQPETVESIWEYCQTEMFTRRDDEKNDKVRLMIAGKQLSENGEALPEEKKSGTPQQMMYNVETIAAGTQFFWRIVLEDVTDVEFEAFLSTLIEFSKAPNIGGKSGTGHGEIAIKLDRWIEIDSRVNLQGNELDVKLGTKYKDHLEKNGEGIRTFLHGMK